MGVVEIEGQNHRLQAEYYADQAKYFAPSGGTNSNATALNRCSTPSALCAMELQIVFNPPDKSGSSLRTIVSHLSSTITAARVADGYLWVRDANGQSWRYSIGSKSILPLLQSRWQGLSSELVKDSRFSNACTAAKCDAVPIPGWPQ
jgi:hypothetical protein